MKAKFIFEAFTQDSDPIRDMGIGLKGIYDNIKIDDVFRVKKDIISTTGKLMYREDTLLRIINVERYPKEEYESKVAELKKPENLKLALQEFKKLKTSHPHLFSRLINCENCSGDDIENSKNCHCCYGVKDSEDCSYNRR